jgi:hypothetical protein
MSFKLSILLFNFSRNFKENCSGFTLGPHSGRNLSCSSSLYSVSLHDYWMIGEFVELGVVFSLSLLMEEKRGGLPVF